MLQGMATGPRWLDEREARAWRGFQMVRAQLGGVLNRQLTRDSDLSMADYEVLVALSEAPGGRLRARDLGRVLQWEKSRLSHHLRRMQGRGLVRREECPSDARGAFAVLTGVGRQAIEAAAPAHLEAVRRYFIDVLTPAQLDALAEITAAVLAGLPADTCAGLAEAGALPDELTTGPDGPCEPAAARPAAAGERAADA